MILPRWVGRVIRHLMKKGDKKRMKKYVFPNDEKVFKNIKYVEGDNESQCFDLLLSEKPCGRLLVHFHGGAYVGGSKENIYPYAEVFRKQGYDVCLVEYRLVNEKTKVNVLDQINDCLNSLKYLDKHLIDYNIKNDVIILSGDSAGGQFALLLQEILDDPELAKSWGHNFDGFQSSCVVLTSPVYGPEEFIKGNICTKGAKRFIFGEGCLEPGFGNRISPRVHISSLKAPVFISTCKNDFINGKGFYQVDLLVKDLTKKNHIFGLININSDDSKIGHVFNVNDPKYLESAKVNEAALSFIDEVV